jgi:hypothetical protein
MSILAPSFVFKYLWGELGLEGRGALNKLRAVTAILTLESNK